MKNKKDVEHFSLKEVNSMWRSILHLGEKKVLTKGTVLEMHLDNGLMLIDKGLISLRSLNSDGRERVSMYMESGCLIGEVPALVDTQNSNRVPLYHVHEESIVYAFPSSFLTDANFIKTYPYLIMNVMESFALKVRYLFTLVGDKSGESSKEIICRYINRLARKNHADVFNPHMSQSEFALSLGLHRSTVCRIIKELREEGVLGEFTKNKLEILDRDTLRSKAFGE